MYQIDVAGGWGGGRDDLAGQFVEAILKANGLSWTFVAGSTHSSSW